MNAGDMGGEMLFVYELPMKVRCYVACLHFAGGRNEKETGTLASRGMRIVDVERGLRNEDVLQKVKW